MEGRSRPRRHGRATTSRPSSGGRRARRSSGTASSSSSATRRPTRSCSRSNADTGDDRLEDRTRRAAVVGHADGRDDGRRTAARDQRVELHPRLRSAHRQGAVDARAQLEDHGADARSSATACSSSPAAARRSGRSSSCARAHAATSRCQAARRAAPRSSWSRTGRGPYMPTPLDLQRAAATCSANNGVFDAYQPENRRGGLPAAAAGDRQRLQRVAGRRGRQDLPVERGRRDARRRRPDRTFTHIATNSMGEPLMATPALVRRRHVRALGVVAVCDWAETITRDV